MAAPAPRRAQAETEDAPVDRYAVEQAFALHRARRRARIEHKRELQRARRRFWALVLVLLLAAIFLSLTIREQIQSLFGL